MKFTGFQNWEYNKRIKSKYKYVTCFVNTKTGQVAWLGRITGVMLDGYDWYCHFEKERDAAIAVDKCFIEHGRKPVNILTPH